MAGGFPIVRLLVFLLRSRYDEQERILKDPRSVPAEKQAVLAERRHRSAVNWAGIIVVGGIMLALWLIRVVGDM